MLRALAYFDDIEAEEPPEMLVPWDWDEVKRFFEREVRYLTGELLP